MIEDLSGRNLMVPLLLSSPSPLSISLHSSPTGNIIIKTTYDISLDFQDSLLPLGFLSLSRVRSSSLTLRSFHSPRRAGE